MTGPGWRKRLTRWAPGLIGLGVLGAILWEYSPGAVLAEMVHGDWELLGPVALLTTIIGLFVVALADTWVVRHGTGPVRYLDMIRGKAGSSVLDVVGYAASHGGYAVWIARFARTTTGGAVGVLLYIMASDLAAVCLVASVPILVTDVAVSSTITWITIGLTGLMFALMLAPNRWRGQGSKAAWREPWWRIPRGVALAQVGLRVTQIVVWVSATWISARAFGLEIPLTAMAVYGPVILLAAALPLNIAGFGIAQGAWLLLLDYAPGERIVAFAALWNLALAFAVVVRGLPFLRGVVTEVGEGARRQPVKAESRPESGALPYGDVSHRTPKPA